MSCSERPDDYRAAMRVRSEYVAVQIDPDSDSDSDPERQGNSNNSFQRTRRKARR
jgi:hypothetical protein